MSVTDEYLKNNEAYSSTFSGPLPLPPSKHVAIKPEWAAEPFSDVEEGVCQSLRRIEV